MSIKRAIKRNNQKQNKKMHQEISEKVALFEQLPDACSACAEAFDKKNRKMVFEWNVVVRENENLVRLYCPNCWTTAKRVVKKYSEGADSGKA